MILDGAIAFFADYGLTAQTRALAEAIGVTQRLLYRYYPSKADLLQAVYDAAILAPFKALWLVQLSDRSVPIRTRLIEFYRDYNTTLLTKRWLRLFLYASLADSDMAPDYIQAIVAQLLDTIAEETAAEFGVTLPGEPAAVREVAWILHGSISHYAIRQHVYGASREFGPDEIVLLNVEMFLAGFRAAIDRVAAPERVSQFAERPDGSRQLTTRTKRASVSS
jgi:AcrR family transcriptional regulator